MKRFSGLVAFACVAGVFFSFGAGMWYTLHRAPSSVYAAEPQPKLKPHTAEFREADRDTGKLELIGDKEDLKDVEITKLSDQVYRVDVKSTAEGLKEYEAALVKFSKEHPSVHPSPAPRDPRGNVGESVYYWNVDEK